MAAARRSCIRCKGTLTKSRIAKRKRTCFACEVAAKRESRIKAHDRRVSVNGFTAEDYWAMYEAQGGRCAIYGCKCNGRTKFLAIDHDHHMGCGHDPKTWCRSCVRGLVCSAHNSWLGRANDDPRVFDSLADYLRDWPAKKVLK